MTTIIGANDIFGPITKIINILANHGRKWASLVRYFRHIFTAQQFVMAQ